MRPLAVIATMHGKERVLAPLLETELGFDTTLAQGLDTDLFGTFTGEVARLGTQLEAARAKAGLALRLSPDARFAVASEGSFGPHPAMPLIPGGHELVLLLDRETGQEVLGHHVTAKTNYRQALIASPEEALRFAEHAGFPTHALVVGRCPSGEIAAAEPVAKAMQAKDRLLELANDLIARDGHFVLSTDMRAHLNPTRMAAIETAGRDLVAGYASRCRACDRPGFVVNERIPGLPCGDCGTPTRMTLAEVRRCVGCGETERRDIPGMADPTWCDGCNP